VYTRWVRALLWSLVALAVLGDPAPLLAEEAHALPLAVSTPLHSQVDVLTLPAPSASRSSAEAPVRVKSRLSPNPDVLRQWRPQVPGGVVPDAIEDLGPRSDTPPTRALSVVSGFEGLSDANNIALVGFPEVPPDPVVGAGVSHLFQMVNSVGRISNKAGAALSSFTLRSFFGLDPNASEADPRVLYDAGSGRWFATEFQHAMTSATTGTSSVILAVSTTSDPTGTFCRYRLGHPTTETFVHDFPQLGVSDGQVVVSFLAFSVSPGDFLGAAYYVVNKADLIACGPSARFVRAPPNPSRFTEFPATSLSGTSVLYLAMNNGTSVTVFGISGVPGVGPVIESATTLGIRPWDLPPLAPQAGSGVLLDTGLGDVISATWRDNSLWIAGGEACIPPGDGTQRSCLRVIEIRTDSLSVRQDTTFGATGQYYSFPAVSPDGAGNAFIVFTASSPSEFAGVRVTGRAAGDPLNTLQASTLIRAGGGAQTSFRMGDYSGVALDPADTSKVWVTGEYIQSTGPANWGTWIGQLTVPPPPPNVSLALTLNTHTVKAGDLVQVSVGAANSGGPAVLDLYFVIVAPAGGAASLGCADGVALVFFGSGFSAFLTCSSAAPQTFPPLIQSVSIPAGLPPVMVPNFFSFVWPAGAPPGTYSFALFATPPGAFGDGRIDQGDVTATGLDSLTF